MKVLIVLAAVCIATAVATAGWGSPPPPPPPKPSGWGWGGGHDEPSYPAEYYGGGGWGGSSGYDKYDYYRPREHHHRHKGKHATGYVPPSRHGYYPSYPYYPKNEGWGNSGGYYGRH